MKAAIVIHRVMRETEGDHFMKELCSNHKEESVGMKGIDSKRIVHPLHMDSFLDVKTSEGKYDFSEWVRAYCRYIDETLDVYHHTGWYSGLEKSGGESKMRMLGCNELLDQLPRIQKIQRRLVDCMPHGAAKHNDNTLVCLMILYYYSEYSFLFESASLHVKIRLYM